MYWTACYENGDVIEQGDISHVLLPKEGLKTFEMWDFGRAIISIPIQEGELPIYRERFHLSMDTGIETSRLFIGKNGSAPYLLEVFTEGAFVEHPLSEIELDPREQLEPPK